MSNFDDRFEFRLFFSFKNVLCLSFGKIRGQVKKKRTLFICGNGQTRIHLDDVEGLSNSEDFFVEIEVVLGESQTVEEGRIVAENLCRFLGIDKSNIIDCAYIDLLEQENK